MEIQVGRVIASKYRLVRLLGRGSMGEVWAADHVTLGEHVALKLLHAVPEESGDPNDDEGMESPQVAAARFQFEAQLAARLSRKTRHIVRVTDHGREDDLDYLVMELLDGESLENRIVREMRFSIEFVGDLVRQMGRALAAAHADKVAHRDLKPANVFLTTDEDGHLLAKLLDFGIARALHAHRAPGGYATARGMVFGTPAYMSPEQARGEKSLDHRCDLWSLATIAYECATGEMPVDGDDSDTLLRNLCSGRVIPIERRDPSLAHLSPFFARAFHDSVDKRYPSALEMIAAFERASGVSREPSRMSAPSFPEVAPPVVEDLPRHPSRRKAVMAVGGAFVLVAGVLAWRALSAEPAPVPAPVAAGAKPPTVGSPNIPPPPVATLAPETPGSDIPATQVSALPRARGGPPAAGSVAASTTKGAPPAGTALTPTPPAAPPAAPAPASTGKGDKSEVF